MTPLFGRARSGTAALLTFATATAATAQGSRPDNVPIVVTASRTESGPATDLSIVSEDDLAQHQSATLLDALQDVAGVRAFSTGGVGGGSFVSIRGGEPNFTLVLIDGIRVNDPTNSKGGAFDFAQIDPGLVRAIEVSRGAGSAVHGSDALSGAINLRLREPVFGAAGINARIDVDTLGARGGTLGLGQGWRDGGLFVAGSWFDSGDGDPGASLQRAQGIGRLRQRIGGFDLTALGLYAQADRAAFPEDSGGPLYAVNRARETGSAELWTAGLALRRTPSAMLRPNISISFSRQGVDTATPRIAPGALAGVPALTSHDRLTRIEAIGDLTLTTAPVTATLGVGYRDERGTSDGTIDFGFARLPARFTITRTTASGFAEATVRLQPGVTISAGVRYDKVGGGPGEVTGRAALSWQPVSEGATLFARFGQGFKLPSFYALGHPLVGNPALRPERSRSIEGGIDWPIAAGTRMRISAYHNSFRDLIDFDPVSFRVVNRAHVETSGFELEGSWQIAPQVTLSSALSRVALKSPTPLRGRPGWFGNARAVWTATPRLELNAAVRFNSDFDDSSVPTGPIITPGHGEVDLGVRYRISNGLTFEATLRNLGDSRYQDAVGSPARGRFLRATVRATTF